MFTLTRVMGDANIRSVEECYNRVLGQLVRLENFRYVELNFVSVKSKLCEAIFADSPYPHIILACEKESYHAYLKRLAHVFHRLCRKFCSGSAEGTVAPFGGVIRRPGHRTVRPA